MIKKTVDFGGLGPEVKDINEEVAAAEKATQEDGEAALCMYVILNTSYTAAEFINLPQKEKAFVVACVNRKIAAEKEVS